MTADISQDVIKKPEIIEEVAQDRIEKKRGRPKKTEAPVINEQLDHITMVKSEVGKVKDTSSSIPDIITVEGLQNR